MRTVTCLAIATPALITALGVGTSDEDWPPFAPAVAA